jgi:hypothetical protein
MIFHIYIFRAPGFFLLQPLLRRSTWAIIRYAARMQEHNVIEGNKKAERLPWTQKDAVSTAEA